MLASEDDILVTVYMEERAHSALLIQDERTEKPRSWETSVFQQLTMEEKPEKECPQEQEGNKPRAEMGKLTAS